MIANDDRWPEAEDALAQLRSLGGPSLNDPTVYDARRRASTRLYELARQYPERAMRLLERQIELGACAQDPTPCGALAGGLVAVKYTAAASVLARMLDSAETEALHEDLAEDLGNIGNVGALPALIQALHHRETWVRAKAARSLGQLGSKDAGPALLSALDDESEAVRLHAVRALGELGAREAIQRLETIANEDEDEDVQEAALEALRELRE